MSISHPFNGTAFPWRKKKLESLIEADDAPGLEKFLQQHPRAVEWEVVHGPNHHLFIHEAVEKQKYDATKVLLEHGARTDTLSKYKHTLMQHALRVVWGSNSTSTPENLRMAQLLLDHGADINQQDIHKRTNLCQAGWMANVPAAQFLIDRGADASIGMNRGTTVLMNALNADGPRAGILKVLLTTKPDVNARNDSGMTALTYAREAETARMLMEAGADPQTARRGTPAYDVALEFQAAKEAERAAPVEKDIGDASHNDVPAPKSRVPVLVNKGP